MASKIELQSEARVGIEALWNAMSKDKFDIIDKAMPGLLKDRHVIDGDGGLHTLFSYSLASPDHVPPVTEKVVEYDETKHAVSFQGIEGGYKKLGFIFYIISFLLDDMGEGKTSVKSTITYELDKGINGTPVLEEFTNIIERYIEAIVSYLQKNSV